MRIPLTLETYQHPSKDANTQQCINMFRAASGPLGRGDTLETPGVLLSRRGKRLIADLGGGPIRAIMNNRGTLYVVSGDKFYLVEVNTNTFEMTSAEQKGTLNSSIGIVKFDFNPTQIMMVDGYYGYIFTPETDTFEEITDPDFQGANTVVYIDGYFFYSVPDSPYVACTAINDGTDVSALDIVSAEGRPDNIVGVLSDKRELWAFGEKTVEIYYDTANPQAFPFSRRDGAFVDQGCAAAHSILNIDNTIFWLDDRRYIVQVGASPGTGYAPMVVSDPSMSNIIQNYVKVDDAVAWQENDRGHLTYNITFPTANATWSYDITEKLWHQKAYFSQDDEFDADLTSCREQYLGRDLVGDRRNGNVYILDDNYFTDNGDPIHRLVTTSTQNVQRNNLAVDELEIILETGKAEITDPEGYVMMRYSVDGGYSWSSELVASLGKSGEYAKRVIWTMLGAGRSWNFQFRIVAPCKVSIIDAFVRVSGELETR